MSETRIEIKELEMNVEAAIRIAECLKKHEPEIWKVLSGELKQALRIHDVVGQSEQLVCDQCKCHPTVLHNTTTGRFCDACKPKAN